MAVALVGFKKCAQLGVDSLRSVYGCTRASDLLLVTATVPTLDLVRKRCRLLKRQTIEQVPYFVGDALIFFEPPICNCANQVMSAWSIRVSGAGKL